MHLTHPSQPLLHTLKAAWPMGPSEGPHVTVTATFPVAQGGRAGWEFVQPSGSRKTVPAPVGRARVGGLGKECSTMRPRSGARGEDPQRTGGAQGSPRGAPLGAGPPPLRIALPTPAETLVFKKERQRREREGLELGRDGKGSRRRKTQRGNAGPNPQSSRRNSHRCVPGKSQINPR